MRTEPPHPLEPVRHERTHPSLDSWRANTGDPVAIDVELTARSDIEAVDVLCWNVAIGLGRVEQLLDRLLAGEFVAPSDERPIIVLLQEAFRGDDGSVPDTPRSGHHGGKAPRATRIDPGPRHDIVSLARRLGMSLRYAPSMRNGAHASDRGNAILSNVRLTPGHSLLLPYVRQRRVAVAAALHGHGGIRFVSAHLDTHGPAPGRSVFSAPGSGRAAQAQALADSLVGSPDDPRTDIVLGADLNSMFGLSDPAVLALVRSGFRPARRIGRWRHTFHTPLRGMVDHVLFSPGGRIAGTDVIRLDESAGDRTRRVFGSDHHPLLAHVRLHPGPSGDRS